jgi:hypothetical protein
VTRPPSHPVPGAPADEEVLDELGDDAIVAQQAAIHALQPRAQVDMEARTIVVAEEPPELDPSEVMETRQLPQYGFGAEPTTAARRAASRAPTMVLRRVESFPPPKRRNWMVIGIWVAAGVVAFGFGGVLAALTARGSDSSASATPAAALPPPAPTRTAPPPKSAPPPAKAPDQSQPPQDDTEAITASDLPVEPVKPTRRPRTKSPANPAGTPAVPTKTTPEKTAIPEGI